MDTILAFIAALIMNSSFSDQSLIDKKEVFCLAKTVYHEARGEPIEGQIAVAHVVLNRVNSERYPDKVCDVVYQKHQFTDINGCKPKFNSVAWKTAVEVAILSKIGFLDDPTGGAKWYYAHHKIGKPKWASKKELVTKIGGHSFFRTKSV